MPTTIKLKNSVTTTNAPSSLAQGEVAINITDKKVWVGNAATTPIQLLGAGGSATFGALTCTSLTDSGLTSGRVTYATTAGLLTDSANLTFNGTTLTAAAITSTGAFAANGGATLGDASGDALTINSSAVSIPNGLNFDSDTFVIDAANNRVGIGTSSPVSRLDVTGIARFSSTSFVAPSGGRGVEVWYQTDSDKGFTGAFDRGGSVYKPFQLFGSQIEFNLNGSEAMRIDSSGNVGIGTSSPSYRLHTNGGDVYFQGANVFLQDDTKALVFGTGTTSYIIGSSTNNNQRFITNSAERMRIDSSGNVGIGTSSPQARLQVTTSSFPVLKVADNLGGGAVALGDSTINNNYVGIWRGAANSISGGGFLNVQGNGIAFMSSDNVFGSGTERMRITSGGDFCVGTTGFTGAAGFSVAPNYSNGSATAVFNRANTTNTSFAFYFQNNATTVGSISYTNTATAYTTSSDYRLKENIAPMTGALGVVQQLKPVTYTWKTDGSAGQGFIAHELQAVVPDAVTGEKDAVDADGKPVYQGVDTSFLIATLTAAIQELKAELDSVKAELNQLKGA